MNQLYTRQGFMPTNHNNVIPNRAYYYEGTPRKVVIRGLIKQIWNLTIFRNIKVRSRIKYGMTPVCNHGDFTPRSVTPQCRYAGYSGRTGFTPTPRHAELVSASCRSIKKVEALNKDSFRAPLRSGFTLVELLVVVLIIGILAAVAVPQYQKAVIKSRYATLKNLTKSLAQAQETYYLANGEYAFDFSALDVEIPATAEADYNPTDKKVLRLPTTFGYCQLSKRHLRVNCTDTQIEMSYFIRLHFANKFPDTYMCRVEHGNANSIAADVCRIETDHYEANDTTDTYQQWEYQ